MSEKDDLSIAMDIAENFFSPMLQNLKPHLREVYGPQYKQIFHNGIVASYYERTLPRFVSKLVDFLKVPYDAIGGEVVEFIASHSDDGDRIIDFIRKELAFILICSNHKTSKSK